MKQGYDDVSFYWVCRSVYKCPLFHVFLDLGYPSRTLGSSRGRCSKYRSTDRSHLLDDCCRFSTALAAFTGQNYGAGNYERIRKGYRLTLGIAGSIGLGAGILFFVLNHEIFGLFVNEPEAIEAGGNYLKILALSQLFMVTESVTAGAFNGTGHTTPPALTGIIFTGARIPMAYFLTSFPQLGLTGIWWSITISSILKGSVLPLWFLHFQRKLK